MVPPEFLYTGRKSAHPRPLTGCPDVSCARYTGSLVRALEPTRIAAFSLAQKANSGRSFLASFGVRAEACFCAGGPGLEGVDARLSRDPTLLGTMYRE